MGRKLMIAGLVALLLTPSFPALALGLGRLSALSGTVRIQLQGSGEWQAAQEGQEVGEGDVLSTGSQSQAVLIENDGTRIELQPLTEMTLENADSVLVKLGRVWSNFVHREDRSRSVRTPGATALIRGTTLSVGFADRQTEVLVYEGLVEVRGQGDSREMVGSGFRIRADDHGRLERMERAGEDMMREGRGFRERHGLEGLDRLAPPGAGLGAPSRGTGPGGNGPGGDRGAQPRTRGPGGAGRPEGGREIQGGPGAGREGPALRLDPDRLRPGRPEAMESGDLREMRERPARPVGPPPADRPRPAPAERQGPP